MFPAGDPLHSTQEIRSHLAVKTDERVPGSFRDKTTVASFPHTAALMGLINELETVVQEKAFSSDCAVQLNRRAMRDICDIIESDGFRDCQSCSSLVATVLDLIVGLYELVLIDFRRPLADEASSPSFTDGQESVSAATEAERSSSRGLSFMTPPSSAMSSMGTMGTMPTFKFGCVELDPEEQTDLRTRMMKRDLQTCISTIEFCDTSIRQILSSKNSSPRLIHGRAMKPFSVEVHKQWYKEMLSQTTQMLKALLEDQT